jgi:hypothetical protein
MDVFIPEVQDVLEGDLCLENNGIQWFQTVDAKDVRTTRKGTAEDTQGPLITGHATKLGITACYRCICTALREAGNNPRCICTAVFLSGKVIHKDERLLNATG